MYYIVKNNTLNNRHQYLYMQLIPPKLDEFGREIEKPIDVWEPRRGVALALTKIAPLLDNDVIGDLIEFFVSTSLSDRKEKVRKEMLTAALAIVDLHGKVMFIVDFHDLLNNI